MTGSVARTSGLHPEEAADLINGLLASMVEALSKYGGRVDRYLGDGLLAVFGTGLAHENDPERAIKAALELRGAAERLNIPVTVGINTGEVYVGIVGSELHLERSVIGSVVNLAARMQGQAKPGQIIVGESTYRRARRSFEFSPLTLKIKGIDQPVLAFTVEGDLLRPEKVRGIEGLQANLIGRVAEFSALRSLIRDLSNGKGQVVAIIGEAGLGKSRLVREVKASTIDDNEASTGVRWLEGRALEFGVAGSYGVFIDLLQEFFGVRQEEDGPAREKRIVQRLLDLEGQDLLSHDQLKYIAPFLGNLLSAASSPEWDLVISATSPQALKYQTFSAIRQLCTALAKERPLVLVLEDLHWADSVSLDLINYLMDSVSGMAMMLMCVYRQEADHKSSLLGLNAARKLAEGYREILLTELNLDEGGLLLDALFPDAQMPKTVKALIVEKTRGNPFFVEEVVRSLIDSGIVYQQEGVWRIKDEITQVDVPDTVQGVILSRIDRLEQRLKRLLESASVIGRYFLRSVLECVRQESELESPLRQLEDQGLIYQERVVPEEEFSFRHVLTQETVYQTILLRRRLIFHERVAEAIEALYPSNLADYLDQLAFHYERSTNDLKAVHYLYRAAASAQRGYVNDEAISYYSRCLSRIRSAKSIRAEMTDLAAIEIRAHEGLADVLARVGRFDEARAEYMCGIDESASEECIRLARLHRKVGNTFVSQRDHLELAEEALNIAESSLGTSAPETDAAWWDEWVQLRIDRMWVLYWQNEPDRIRALSNEIEPTVQRFGSASQQGMFNCAIVVAILRRDRYRGSVEAVHYARTALELGKGSGDHEVICHLHFSLGFTLLWSGDLASAWEQLQAGLELAERIGQADTACLCLTYLATICRKRGQVDETYQFSSKSLAVAIASGNRYYIGAAKANIAWVLWRAGELEQAKQHANEALDLWTANYMFQWTALFPLVGIAISENNVSEAVEHARAMLGEAMQRLPDELEEQLLNAVDASNQGDPHRALAVLQTLCQTARTENYV